MINFKIRETEKKENCNIIEVWLRTYPDGHLELDAKDQRGCTQTILWISTTGELHRVGHSVKELQTDGRCIKVVP